MHRSEVLIAPAYKEDHGAYAPHRMLAERVKKIASHRTTRTELVLKEIRELYKHYEYTDLASHPAAVIIPYQGTVCSTHICHISHH